MPINQIDPNRRFTGKKDIKGNPIHEGDTVVYGMAQFLVIQWGEYKDPDGEGIIVGFFIPDECEVIGPVSINKPKEHLN